MRRLKRILFYTACTFIALIVVGLIWFYAYYYFISGRNMKQLTIAAPVIKIDGFSFRDLNKNSQLDIYEDRRQAIASRVDDLLKQMTLEEKVGTMFHTLIGIHPEGELLERPLLTDPYSFASPINSEMVVAKKMNHFNLFMIPKVTSLALWYNNFQKLAERTRLGIPITISSDPRNHITPNSSVVMFKGEFSLWPEPLGLAATGDSVLVKQFGDIARQEYLAAGIRVVLNPMADLATEPRWPRINGTFGEDAHLASKMVYAYIKGFQGDSLGTQSVACMTKHFSGGGPQKEGLDPHFPFQKGQVYPGNNFNYHLIPFEAAFKAGTAQIMPYYGVPMGQTSENVGFGYNKEIITGMLRNKYHFDGVVCSDWGLVSDAEVVGYTILKARAHGVENLSKDERIIKIINAGVDQFGGEMLTDDLIRIVKEGKVSETRIDESVRRLLRDKFKLGLFDNPYINAETTATFVASRRFQEAGQLAQRKSIVLLKNKEVNSKKTLPLTGRPKIYIQNIDKTIASLYGDVVDKPEQADLAIIRLQTPFQPKDGILAGLFHHGDLDFKDPAKADILKLLNTVPTVVDIYLDRPAVIPEIADKSAALLANFGADDNALLDIVFGKFNPSAHLPIELPSSMEAVRKQKEDVPYDSEKPLFPFGFGLSY